MKDFKRLNGIFLFIVFLFVLVVARLFYLQILHGEDYRKEAEDQYVYDSGEEFDRGSIYMKSKNGTRVPVAEMSSEYSLAIDPRTINSIFKKYTDSDRVEKINKIYESLKAILAESGNDLTREEFLNRIAKKDSAYEIISQNISGDVAEKIIAAHIKGVIVNRKKSRYYNEKEVGAKVLGFVGYKGEEKSKTGLYGLEKYYNDVLGLDNQNKKVNFFAEVFADLNGTPTSTQVGNVVDRKGEKGSLILTLDVGVERFLHDVLEETKNKWNSEIIGGIIIDPNTGAIVAMEELPTFDPNQYSKVENIKYYNNDLVSGVYEMGSIIKPLTMAAGLDSGAITKSTTYNDTGVVELSGYKVYNYDKKARGVNTSMQTVLDKSLNVGISFIVQRLGGENLRGYFEGYGIGSETGIELPGEASGLTSNLSSGVVVDAVTAGFGQGIALTPVQTVRALSVLANGGKIVNPHIVDSIESESGEVRKIIPDDGVQVFKNTSTSKTISEMLVHVVDTSMKSGNPNYSVAAKTGTAQIPDPVTHKYYTDRYLHSFFGYFPATDPKYLVFIYHTNPRGAQYASETLKPAFFKIVNFLISYFEIPGDRKSVPKY